MRFRVLLLFLLLGGRAVSQPCSLKITGQVNDRHDGTPLWLSNIYIEETGTGVAADSNGNFQLGGLCPGKYHLQFSHLGCEPVNLFIVLKSDTSLKVQMEHHAAFLQPVEVEANGLQSASQAQQVISREELNKETGKTITEILTKVPGVTAIRSGSGISKPVIHGLYGNRVAIVNNGLVQAGQQWGNDHAPEIDPFTAERITVIKGADAVEYGGNGLGGVILVEPGPIDPDPHLHGAVNYLYNTNGSGHSAVTRIGQGSKFVNWRLTGTYKMIGDRKAPDYFLTNTGNKELNYSLQLARQFGKKWFLDAYYSRFTTTLGILRGSHTGNLTDLEQAIGSDVPLFTKPGFSYDIEAPRQEVIHRLLKAKLKHYMGENSNWELTYGGQENRRQEFDVRRGGRTDTPSLDLSLTSHSLGYSINIVKDKLDYKAGIQYRRNENRNDPGTGILPLIPDYDLDNAALFARVKYGKGRNTYEAGARYDLQALRVRNISRTVPRVFENHEHLFHNYSIALGISHEHRLHAVSMLNAGVTRRSPEVNELYSFGLHQGAAGIEEGNTGLRPETAVKAVYTGKFVIHEKWNINGSIYSQYIDRYIFLEPQEDFRLTIRGAFPVFLYRQTNAMLNGADLSIQYEPFERAACIVRYAMVRGKDLDNNEPLVYMPADRVYGECSYILPVKGKKQSIKLSVNGEYVMKQTRLEAHQDFLSPPPAYFLTGVKAEAGWTNKKVQLDLFIQVENLFDTVYRDYLNRLRYYADAEGRNIRCGVKVGF